MSQLRVSHGVVPSAMGSVAGASTAVGCALGHDSWERVWYDGCVGGHHGGGVLLRLVLPIDRNPVCDGRHQRYAALAAVALGRGYE